MNTTRILLASSLLAAALVALPATQAAPPMPGMKTSAAPAPPPPAAPAGTCKTFGAGKCCSPDVTMHLPKDAVYSACGESDATFIGEAASKDSFTCSYHFKVEGEPSEDTFVQVYLAIDKNVLDKPNDPFFSYKKVGKVWMADKAKSPKAAQLATSSTGFYAAGKGYAVIVKASTKVCTKNEAITLSKSMK